jgi:import inner membrane translocase subunit TIM9
MDQLNAREQQEFQQLVEKKQVKDFMRVSVGRLYRRLRDLR